MMQNPNYPSWNGIPKSEPTVVYAPNNRFRPLPVFDTARDWIAYGMGRSYGDVCLNEAGGLILTRQLDRFISFDQKTGVLRCESGVTLEEIIHLVLPMGWFLAVTPGTQFVTVGGAVANDVHGKNHRRMGSFGHHLRAFELVRSDGCRYLCAPDSNPEWFRATIGGLGLTGLITWVEIQLRPVRGPWLDVETIRFHSLEEYFELSRDSVNSHEYLVSWLDCLGKGKQLGRGLLYRANHSAAADPVPQRRSVVFPAMPYLSVVNRWSVKIFNEARYRGSSVGLHQQSWEKFFYPLDAVRHWYRMYGPRGFYQHQSVVPSHAALAALKTMLGLIANSGDGSFLVVLKEFGSQDAKGMLSFPRAGTTLALDFPNRGESTLALLKQLDAQVVSAGGAIYPAKDARMSPETFAASFPDNGFVNFIDPRSSSGFWRRMQGSITGLD